MQIQKADRQVNDLFSYFSFWEFWQFFFEELNSPHFTKSEVLSGGLCSFVQ